MGAIMTIEVVQKYDLLPGVDQKAYAELMKKVVAALLRAPGLVEIDARRNLFFTIAAATGTIPACRAMPDMGALTDKGHYVFAQGVASGDPRDE
jgi:hypothetical protein